MESKKSKRKTREMHGERGGKETVPEIEIAREEEREGDNTIEEA